MSILEAQRVPAEYADAKMSGALAGRMPKGWQSVLLIGPAGTGKTTTLWALHAKYVTGSEHNGCQKVHVISECGDIDRYRYDWDWLTAWATFRGVLCIDDIGYREPQSWTKQAVYYLATERRAHNRRVIWTTNLTRERLEEWYGAPITSRIAGGEVIHTGGDDHRLAK